MISQKNTNFTFGEIGDVLDANRDNAAFQNSAKEITNMYVTERATLKVMKKFSETSLFDGSSVMFVSRAFEDFYIVVTQNTIYSVQDGVTPSVISSISIGKAVDDTYAFNSFRNIQTQDDGSYKYFVTIVKKSDNLIFRLDDDGTGFETYSIFDDIKIPVSDSQELTVDFWYFENNIPDTKIASLTTPLINVFDGDTSLAWTQDSGLTIRRDTYFLFYDGDIKEKKWILHTINGNVVHIKTEKENVVIGNNYADFIEEISLDADGFIYRFPVYFFGNFALPATNETIGSARILQGKAIFFTNNLTSLSVFQNRLVATNDSTIFFSKIGDYFDFSNYINDDSPFYFTPQPINGKQPNLLNSNSSKGLFITSDQGVYAIAYNQLLTPATAYAEVVSNMPSTNKIEVVDTTVFCVGEDKKLYSIQEQIETSATRLYPFVVEKYAIDFEVKDISILRLDRKNRLIVTEENNENSYYLYDILQVDDFRRVKIELNHDGFVKGIGSYLFTQYNSLKPSKTNMSTAEIKLHQPSMYTDTGGTLFNDEFSTVQAVTAWIINQDAEQINNIYFGKKENLIRIGNAGDPIGRASKYRGECHFEITDGFYLQIETTESEGIIEISAIEYFYDVSGIYGEGGVY